MCSKCCSHCHLRGNGKFDYDFAAVTVVVIVAVAGIVLATFAP